MHLTIGIITCNRPDGLTRLLHSLAKLEFPDAAPSIEILVVDNDPDGAARTVVEAVSADIPFPVRYEIEKRRGIPHARNAVVDHADPETDFIAYIDDDETVDPDWLAALLAVQAKTNADVVTGPAIAKLPDDAPDWMAHSGAFDLVRYRTGEERPFAFTHNVLTRRSVFDALDTMFDTRMNACGGSDTHFYRRVREAGFTIVWADDAIAHEWVPPGRTNTAWLLRRALRIGGTDTFIERDLAGGPRAFVTTTTRAARYVARALVRLLGTPARGKVALIGAGQDGAHALGLLAGWFGYRYPEYEAGR